MIHVTEEIDAFSKITKEAAFQKLSPGGWINQHSLNSHHKLREALLCGACTDK